MSRRNTRIAAVLVLIALVASAALLLRGRPAPIVEQPTPPPTSPPTSPPTRVRVDYTPVPEGMVSPIVVQRTPARGEELRPDGAIELVFDRPMDQAAVEAAFSLAPAVPGQAQWVDARTFRFKPAQALPRAALYDVTLGQAARAVDGAPLDGALQFRFATAGYLEVGQVIPADGAGDVQAGATITVLFNRPVVPLQVVEQQANAPQPLTFEPAVAGKGEWLNTAVYVFHPDAPLAGGTTYAGRVAAGLTGVDGSPLQGDYSWKFTTARPQVLAVAPEDGARLVPIEAPITVQFNQPVDQASAQGAFHLRDEGGADVAGALQSVGTTLVFTPSRRLAFDATYMLQLDAGIGGAAGAGLATSFNSSFHTVPLPKIVGTQPADGDGHASPYTDFAILFNAPIDPATVMANVQMTPPLSPTQVYTYFTSIYPGDTSVPAGAAFAFHIGFGARPSTSYAARIGPNIADPYGNTTGQTVEARFRTDPLPPSIQIVSPGWSATYSARNPARVGLSSTNVSQASLTLYRLSADVLTQGYQYWGDQPPPGAQQLRQWTAQISAPLDQPTLSRVDLVEGGGRLDPGVYLLRLAQPQGQPQPHVLVVSNLNLTLKAGEREALVWANDLASGQPVAGLPLEFFDGQGAALGTATTDAQGVARLKIERAQPSGVVALAREPFAAVGQDWSSGISPWDFGVQGGYGGLPKMAAHVYTDRPIYRPGQAVDFKGVLRDEHDASFSLPQGGKVQVAIISPTGEQIFQKELPLGQNGTFDGSLKLPDGAALGQYGIGVTFGDQSFGFPFQVAAYRPPEFQVEVKPQASEIISGTQSSATAQVSYFFGGPVASAPVQWNVLAEPYRFAPDWAARYRFGDSDDPWGCFDCWWLPPTPAQPILSGSGTTDAQGRLTIDIPADLLSSQKSVVSSQKNQAPSILTTGYQLPAAGSLKLTIEATATGRDNQVISGRDSVIVHVGGLYVGLASRAYVGQAGDPQQVDLVTADTRGNRLPNQALDVEVFKLTWENTFVQDAAGVGRWESRQQQTSVARQSLTTDAKAEATFAFTPAEGGSYRVVARARDGGGREVRSSLFVWVAGPGYIPWRRESDNKVSLIADKTSYRPGETADILIPSPFTGPHWALITVERGGILSHEVRRMDGNSAVFRLPITAAHAPNVYVTVTLFSPPDGPGKPADFKVGILPLAVAPEPQSLKIALTSSPAQAQPGQAVDYDVQVTDLSGQPVAAELSLDLVDKAVLSLLPRAPDAIREAFYYRRGLGIVTASGLSISADRFMQQFEQDLRRQEQERGRQSTANGTAGGAAGGAAPAAQPTAMPAAAEAPAAPVADGLKSADHAAAQGAPNVAIREQFADTAYWNANVTTDAAGKARVQVTLPDNLTTWVMRGVGLTADTRVGEGTVEVVATKPLLIRPVVPRFFVVGDTVELSANVSNHTGAALEAQVGLAAQGLTVSDPLTKTVQIPANGEASVTWQAQAQDVTSAGLLFTAIAGQYGDASRPRLATGPEGTLPVYRYSAPEIVGTGGQLEAAGSRAEAIGLPPNVDPRSGELTVRLDPSLAAGMQDGLTYLEHYPYECTEQTVSRFLPNVLTARALKRLGIANAELERRLPGLVEEGLSRLYAQQHQDGGWGWWAPLADRPEESNPHISAYVVFGMLRAKEAGYGVRDDALGRGLDYLASKLVAPGRRAADWSGADANQQAWLLYVLGEGGRADRARLDDLYGSREKLAVYGRAFLAMGLRQAGAQPGDGQIKTLLSDLNSAAIVSATGAHWEEDSGDWWSMNTDTRTTAIALDALVKLDPKNQLNPNVVRWLMVARKDGVWETTQETAWSLIGLTDWMDYTGELKADYDYGAWLNDQQQAAGHIGQADVKTPIVLKIKVADLLKQTGNRLTIGRGAGGGRLYYTAHLRAFLPVEEIKALDRGVSVRRRYVAASCQEGPKCPEITEVKLGDQIRVELEIVAPHDLYYLAVEDPLPAGAEAVDTSLATTSILEPGPGLQRPGPGPLPVEGPAAPAARAPVVDIYWPWWNWYSRSELRDEKVALFADHLPRGSYLYSYTIRATQAGEFHVIPTTASEMYFPEVYGRGDGQLLRIAGK